jgi:hypothetical protein
VLRLLVTANVRSSLIVFTLMKEEIFRPERRLLQEPHGVTSRRTAFFLVTVVTSNLTPSMSETTFYAHTKSEATLHFYTL